MKGRNDGDQNAGEKERVKKKEVKKVQETNEPEPKEESELSTKKPKPAAVGVEAFTGRTGGAYIPPARLRAMQAKITDKSSVEFQRISWEALKKSINGLINKVNVGNIENIVRELFQENIVRGRGLMARSIIQAQAASPTFTHVYAALVSIVNTKFPQNGELILRRLIIQFRRGYKRNDKNICLSSTRFIAHLVNQQVAHEVLALEVLTLLLETPTDDSVEVSIGFLKECGQKLTDVSPRGINAIFERLRNILHEGQIDIRVQYMCEVMFAVRKDHFKDFPAVMEDLDLVEEEDQFTHLLTLEDAVNGEDILNVFKPDPAFEENEEKYKILKKEILGEGSSDEEDGSGSGSGSDSEEEESEEDEEAKQKIIDQTETNMVALRRTIYLTIQSSLDFEECAHKLLKMDLKPGQEVELCNMILDCCGQMRTYEKFFGLLAGRFCMIDKKYVEPFQVMFKEQYDTIHRLETNKLRNVAKFFAHLLHTDSISWAVSKGLQTPASRIFIKILFQELSEYLGLPKLNERLKDPTLQEYYAGLLPRDNPRDTRFAINFFTTIGLGGLT
ncbi:pre-mRNA-splicing factor CWC22 homolog [Ruditapes philippinarum]|uniref:pre-mRNA-splicing factor CWC22 homolog n=1 Tax=Ruditapes philippinarum TaxID=129788 RepID=UPI00295BA019|nr:pre-mRNA-splicing factor CWC22 homolog [Ruditapes philippinarum]